MQTRQLGNSDLQITPVGYGAWAIGGSGWQFAWGHQDDSDSVAAIHRALEMGVNWIDTAAVYGLGHSEEVVARSLKNWSGPRPYVFTKCGLRWDGTGKVQKVLRADSIRAEVESSLHRLGVEVIDFYQIHWPPDPDSPELEEGWATLSNLKREGKVRWIGVSNFSICSSWGERSRLLPSHPCNRGIRCCIARLKPTFFLTARAKGSASSFIRPWRPVC